jgi:hypothetical protein
MTQPEQAYDGAALEGNHVEEEPEIQNSPNPFYPGFLLRVASTQPE